MEMVYGDYVFVIVGKENETYCKTTNNILVNFIWWLITVKIAHFCLECKKTHQKIWIHIEKLERIKQKFPKY